MKDQQGYHVPAATAKAHGTISHPVSLLIPQSEADANSSLSLQVQVFRRESGAEGVPKLKKYKITQLLILIHAQCSKTS